MTELQMRIQEQQWKVEERLRLRLFEQEQALRVKKQQEDSKRNARNKRRRERLKETSTNDPLDGEEENIIPK